ncbi:hypothetical protein FD754_007882 [Muntiacus muntjak]|uniref:PQ-loop repeat-containing protein 2 n=1 Tax=Muntiacus muntjak TaxID=9888 RepID=A0A5N3WTZ0_MUNMU|nr:hypothetical protein FD754_007882 [Muntiacus muntjak]
MVWMKLGSANFSSCPNGSSQWIWDVLGECAQDGWDKASVGLGLLSILCFAASTFPQYIKACKTGNMDQALSLWFLLGWIGGDSCNLIGSFLADQLPLQTYTAVYYVLADVLMLSLYFYYKFKKRPSPSLHKKGDHWLRHRLRVQRAVPVLPAASDPHQLPAEVNPGDLVLTVRLGDAGEYTVWTECAAKKPRGGPERGQLCATPPALACGQSGRPAARHHCILQGDQAEPRRCPGPPDAPRKGKACSDGAACPGLGRGSAGEPGTAGPNAPQHPQRLMRQPLGPPPRLGTCPPRGRAAADTRPSGYPSPVAHLPHCPSPPWHPPRPKEGPRRTQACPVHHTWPSKRYSQAACGGLPSPDARFWGMGRDGSQAPGGREGSECGRSRLEGHPGPLGSSTCFSVTAPYLVVRHSGEKRPSNRVPALRHSARSRTVKVQTLVLHLSFPVPHLPHLCNGTIVPPLHTSFQGVNKMVWLQRLPQVWRQ